MPDDALPESLEEAVAGAVTLLTLAVAFGLLAADQSYFWIAFPVGFGGLLPTALALAKWYVGTESESDDRPADEREDALDALRERYARGEIDEAEFERRVERLLETESVEVAEDAYAADRDGERERSSGRDPSPSERERA